MLLKIYRKSAWLIAVALCLGLVAPPARADKPVPTTTESVVLKALKEEMLRAKEILGKKGDPPPYFIGYQVTDMQYSLVSASFGALRNSTGIRQRLLASIA